MTTGSPPARHPAALRVLVLLALVAAPLAFGAVHELAFVPFLLVCYGTGLVSLARVRRESATSVDVPCLPLWRPLVAFHALVLFQLVPLPPFLLRRLSPGSFAWYNDRLLLPNARWHPISVNPSDTLRGFAFLVGFTLLFFTVAREFADERWRRRLAWTVVAVGLFITVVGLAQAAAGTTRIYGLWRPTYDWAVFGPYVNRSHFAGYLVMAIPLAVGFTLEALAELGREWRRRRRSWLALGGPAANAVARRAAEAMVLVVGLVASQSRGGFVAFAASMVTLPFFSRHRRTALVAVGMVALLGLPWLGFSSLVRGFESRGIQASRVDLWQDMIPMFPSFPLFGAGWNAFGSAFMPFQTIWRGIFIGQAHNEYLQVLFDTGMLGAGLFAWTLFVVFRLAVRGATRSPLGVGILGGLLGLAVHALVDFNWQIPANAATYVALAALAAGDRSEAGSVRPSRAP